jgi:cobalamin biosynthesis Mg chelatase CobN
MNKLLRFAAPFVLALGVMTGATAALAGPALPVAPPGQGDCSHGNTGKVCKPDPSTSGKDCDSHGKNSVGGVNEDHCLATASTTMTTTTTTKDKTITTHPTTNAVTPATTRAPTRGPGYSSTGSPTTTTGSAGVTTNAEPSTGNRSAQAPSADKADVPQSAAAEKSGGFLGHKAAGLLPYTGLPIWVVVLVGSAMLAAGWGVRRLTRGH